MTKPSIHPVSHHFLARPEPFTPRSKVLYVPDPDTTVQWVTVLECGPDVRDVQAGDRALCSINTGIWVTDHLLLLPEKAALMLDCHEPELPPAA